MSMSVEVDEFFSFNTVSEQDSLQRRRRLGYISILLDAHESKEDFFPLDSQIVFVRYHC